MRLFSQQCLTLLKITFMDSEEKINKSFAELGFSRDFCEQSERMGFNSIRDVITITPGEIVEKGDFSYSWLAELSDYLSSKGLFNLLQPIPGRTGG
jgi:hypothetical protein